MRFALPVLLALLLRLPALHAEVWLDEILSLDLSREAGSAVGVWTLKHDNNHRLNTLWLLQCPDDAPPWLLRLPSLAAGVASVVLAGLAGERLGAGRFAAWLVASCWWLVLLSTEARGYSLATAFALGAFLAMDSYWKKESSRSLALFWASSILAFLSHLSFLHVYLGFVAWSARKTGDGDSVSQLRKLAAIHAVPAAFLLIYWLTALRGMHVEGGPPAVVEQVLLSLASRGLGGPGAGWIAVAVLLAGLALFVCGLVLLARGGNDVWVFFAVAVLASPLLVLVRRPPFLFERYFALPFVFFLIVVARGLAGMQSRLAIVLLVASMLGSAWAAWGFHQHGRGQVREAIAWIATQDAGPTVAGDDDFRVRAMLSYHDKEGRLDYRGKGALPPGGAAWMLVHFIDGRYQVPDEVADADGNAYALARGWPTAGPADWGWFVFRNAGRKAK